jgi:sulfoxide reductase heme-binding subunit YedZ
VTRLAKPVLFLLCLVPLAVVTWDTVQGNIRGDIVKEIEHRIGYWGLLLLVATLAITPLRRLTGWNRLQSYRRMLGLFAFFYIAVHFAVYLVLDRELTWAEIVTDIGERPYITIGFTGFVLMLPLALTSTKGWIRRLGKRWVSLHSLIYVTALAGVVHFAWSVKADLARPTAIGAALVLLLTLRLAPSRLLGRLRRLGTATRGPAPGGTEVRRRVPADQALPNSAATPRTAAGREAGAERRGTSGEAGGGGQEAESRRSFQPSA